MAVCQFAVAPGGVGDGGWVHHVGVRARTTWLRCSGGTPRACRAVHALVRACVHPVWIPGRERRSGGGCWQLWSAQAAAKVYVAWVRRAPPQSHPWGSCPQSLRRRGQIARILALSDACTIAVRAPMCRTNVMGHTLRTAPEDHIQLQHPCSRTPTFQRRAQDHSLPVRRSCRGA